jgi:hypothetical protein
MWDLAHAIHTWPSLDDYDLYRHTIRIKVWLQHRYTQQNTLEQCIVMHKHNYHTHVYRTVTVKLFGRSGQSPGLRQMSTRSISLRYMHHSSFRWGHRFRCGHSFGRGHLTIIIWYGKLSDLVIMCLLFLRYLCPSGVVMMYDRGVDATSVTSYSWTPPALFSYTHFVTNI